MPSPEIIILGIVATLAAGTLLLILSYLVLWARESEAKKALKTEKLKKQLAELED